MLLLHWYHASYDSLDADSHITCRAHAVPLPCRAAKGLECVSFDLHSAAVSDSHLPCRAHAIRDLAILLKATAQRGHRERACGLNCLRSASSGHHAEFQEVIRRIPISDALGQCETKHRLSWTNCTYLISIRSYTECSQVADQNIRILGKLTFKVFVTPTAYT